jgi:hypothetical protein
MSSEIILLVVAAVPVALISFLRVNAAYVFLSLCLGDFLVTRVAQDPSSFVAFVAPHENTLGSATLELIMLMTPVVATCVFMIFTVHGKVRSLVNFLLSILVALSILLLAVPLLLVDMSSFAMDNEAWTQLSRLSSLIFGVGAVLSLIVLWTQRRHHQKPHHH